MCTGIAIALSDVPVELSAAVPERLHEREGRPELQFHHWQKPALLPVQWEGELQLLPWGSQYRRGSLPYGPWIDLEWLMEGGLVHAHPVEVVVPANLGYDRGTWFLIEEGISGVVIPGAPGGPVVYLLTRPSTNYYRNMAGKCERMPVLVNQTI